MFGRYIGHDPRLAYDECYEYRIFQREIGLYVVVKVEDGNRSTVQIDYPNETAYCSEWMEIQPPREYFNH